MGCSAAETVANDDSPNAASAREDRAKALRVLCFCFMLCVSISVFVKKVVNRGHGSQDQLVRSSLHSCKLLLPP